MPAPPPPSGEASPPTSRSGSTRSEASRADLARQFLAAHVPGTPLLMPNAWDVGSAVLFASLGFDALATTSGGFAASQGRLDGAMHKDEVLAHCGELVAAVDVPVSADLENCFADDPDGVAATIAAAKEHGLAGGSVEDFTGDRENPIYELARAADRVRAAAEEAHRGAVPFVLTARAENYLHHRVDLADTISRLQAYQEAGADVLFAPRVVEPSELRQLLSSVDRPVSVLVTPDAPPVGELAALGASRISVGGAVAAAAYGYAIRAVTELRDQGTANYWDLAAAARTNMVAAFVTPS
jgi:2-methylisocitrate lyase-like PEP mutase family enzyme